MLAKKLCDYNKHIFEMVNSFTGGNTYRCRSCGLTDFSNANPKDDFLKIYRGSIIGNTTYVWKDEMRGVDITSFNLTCGNFPIVEYKYDGKILLFHNRINGSRDGGKKFSKGYFGDKRIELSFDEVDRIKSTLQEIPFWSWHTDIQIFDKLSCCGFSMDVTFSCKLSNGVEYTYYGVSKTHPHGFDDLCMVLASIIGDVYAMPAVEEKNEVIDSVSGFDCTRCKKFIQSGSEFCPWCGGKADFQSTAKCYDELFIEETLTFCPKCGSGVRFVHKYCSHCGKKM